MSSNAERIQELTAKMLRKKLYVVLSIPNCEPDQLPPVLPAHLEYMIALEKKGVLFASGPLSSGDGSVRGEGLTILRAADVDEARRYAAADPLALAGLRTFEVREWTLMEGAMQVTLNFSDQSLAVA